MSHRNHLLPILGLLALCCARVLPADYLVADGVAVLEPPGYDAAKLPPSVALVKPLVQAGPLPAAWTIRAEWSTVAEPYMAVKKAASDGSQPLRYRASFDALAANADLYGTGEQLGTLRRNGRRAFLYAHDNYTYADGPNLYQTHPWVLGVRPDGSAFGLLADTPARGEIDLAGGHLHLDFEQAPFRIIAIDRPSPQEVLRALAGLIGTIELPPKWALGYQQCRYSYMDDHEIRGIADRFRSGSLPCDVLWFDIDYMDGYRIFTFDKKSFPNPAETNAYLHDKGFHSVWMIDPAPKADPAYPVYQQMAKQHLYVATADGHATGDAAADMYQGDVWPGSTGFPDFTQQVTHDWWGGLYRDFLAQGVDGVWNDMNEPAVFNDWKTMPDGNRHRGGLTLPTGTLPPGNHALYHNLYGMLMVKATRDGILAARPDRRPFVLSRSNHLGGQRYAATWTGDNASTAEHLRLATPMCLNLGLSGQPFCGPDLGGFAGECTPALFADWIGVGAFYPFMRGHAMKSTPRKEPWAFGEATERAARIALGRRYRLLPYLYTCFRDASVSGLPVMRPVFFADPRDPALRREENEFLFGPDLLIVPSWAKDAPSPKGSWRSVSLVDGDNGASQAVVRVRPGAIVPAGPVMQFTGEKPLEELTLYVNLDERGEARGQLYEDADDGFGYRSGDYRLTTWTATRDAAGAVALRAAAVDGKRVTTVRKIRIGLLEGDRRINWREMVP